MNKLTTLAICIALPLTTAGYASLSRAANVTSNVLVTATVIESCGLAATPLAFGNYNSLAGATLDAAAMIIPVCSVGTNYSVALNAGLGNGASMVTRKLTGPNGAVLDYGVYSDYARTTAWGDGSGGTTYNVSTGNGQPQSLSIYGRIPASQAVQVGAYSDTITVTLTY